MHLTKFTDYSIRVLLYLAAADRLCTAQEIADAYGISYNHIVKAVHKLSTLGYINSFKGKNGGIKLGKPAGEIELGKLIRRLENFYLLECFDAEKNTCKVSSVCSLKGILAVATRAFMKELDKHTLESICSNRSQLLGALPN